MKDSILDRSNLFCGGVTAEGLCRTGQEFDIERLDRGD